MTSKILIKEPCKIEQEIEDLATDLKSTLITKRLRAVKLLGKLKSPLAIEPLKDVIFDRSKEVRCAVVEAFKQISPANIVELLMPLAKDKSADVRLRVAFALSGVKDENAINCLFDLIRDPNDSVASAAAKSLSHFPTLTLARLIKLFGDKQWKVRSHAALAVSKIGQQAEMALQAAIEDPDPNIRYWSCICLGHLRNKNHTQLLLNKLTDKDLGVRVAALKALKEISDPSVVGKLFEALSQPSDQIRDLIYEILQNLGTYSIPYLLESLSSDYWLGRALAAKALAEMGTEAVAPLLKALDSEDKNRKFWAIKILGQMKEPTAFNEIKKFLNDNDSEIRLAAVQAIGNYNNSESVYLLIEKFIDPSWVVRKEASKTLVSMGNSTINSLLSALNSAEEDIRYWALRTLGELKPPGGFNSIVKLLRDRSWNIRKTAADVLALYGESALIELSTLATETDVDMRFWILQILGKIGSKISLPILYRSLEDPSESIRTAAQKALANYGEAILDDLLALFKSDNRKLLESVVGTIKNMNPSNVLPKISQNLGKYDEHVNYWLRRAVQSFGTTARQYVLPLLESKNAEIRRQALLALASIGLFEDAETVVLYLKDEHWPCRIAAAETLGKLKNPMAVDYLIDALDDDDEELAINAAKALGEIGDQKAVAALISALTREYWSLKVACINALAKLKAKRAIPDLIKLLDEETLDLKFHVLKALATFESPDIYIPLKERFNLEKDIETQIAYIEALSATQNPDFIQELIELAKPNKPWEIRRASIRALAKYKALEAKPTLISALKERDILINREALLALKEILPPNEYSKIEEAHIIAKKKDEEFQAHFNEGLRLLRLNLLGDAEKELKAAAKINPKNAYVYSALGNIYYKCGKLIDATKAYTMAVTLEPKDIMLKMNLAMVYYRRRAYHEALEIFNLIIKETNPNSQQAIYANKMIEKIKIEQNQSKQIHNK